MRQGVGLGEEIIRMNAITQALEAMSYACGAGKQVCDAFNTTERLNRIGYLRYQCPLGPEVFDHLG